MSAYRIGLLVPSSNTVMEPDLQREFLGLATVHTARMRLLDPVTTEGEFEMLDEYTLPAATDIGSIQPDLVVFGCTSAGALRGKAGDRHLRAQIAEVAGAPAVGVLDAIRSGLQGLGVRRVALLTPYVKELTDTIAEDLVDDGFDVVDSAGMEIENNVDIGRVSPEEITEFGLDRVSPRAEAVAIACTNFRAVEAREQLSRALNLPVITANSSVVDTVRARLGLKRS